MTEALWRHYAKDSLHPGWIYPVGRDWIQALLRESAVQVDSLELTMPPPDYRPLQLVRVRRYADLSVQGKSLQQDEEASGLDPVALSIYAVRRDQIESAREAFSAGYVLERAVDWIVSSRTRGNAWQATERLWRAHLGGPSIVTSGVQRQSGRPLLGSIGIEEL